MSHRCPSQRGFTLIEVMVAITILALLALMSFRGIARTVDLRGRAQADMELTGNFLRAMSQLERDLAQRLPEVALIPNASPSALPRSVSVEEREGTGIVISILRMALSPEGAMRAQRVRYTVEGESLVRYATDPSASWPIVEAGNRVVLDTCARHLSARISSNGIWFNLPMQSGTTATIATGIEISLQCDDQHRYVKVIAL